MKRQFNIRQSLLFGLTLLILFTSSTILISSVIGAFRTSQDLTREVIDEAGLLVGGEVERYFKEVERSLRIVSIWAKTNELDPSNEQHLTPLLQPLIAESPRISSIMIADNSGAELMFLQDPLEPESWTTRLIDPKRWKDQAYIRKSNQHSGVLSEGLESYHYETKNRLYYQEAMAADNGGTIVWTQPSIFFVTHDPGMTAVTRWTNTSGDSVIAAFDVLLLDVSRMTATTKISQRGSAFVFLESDPHRLVGLPGDGNEMDDSKIRARLMPEMDKPVIADTSPELPVAGNSGIAPLDAAVRQWESNDRPNNSLRFKFEKENWWAHFSRISVGQNSFVVGTIAPQSDFLSGLDNSIRRIALVTLVAILLSSLLAIRLASSFARPLEALAEASRRIRDLDLSPGVATKSHFTEIQDLVDEQERTRLALDSFTKYMPVEIVRDLVAKGKAAKIGGDRREITILFTDIQGFTGIAESRTAEAVTELLTDYFETLLETIRANGGEVNQLLGDGLVAYWGAPVPFEDHANRAVKAILRCHEEITALGERFVKEGKPILPTRFGVATGEVMVGNLGSKSRLAYAAVGDTANLASRIEGLNRFYGTRLLVAEETRNQAGGDFEWRHVDGVRAKGKAMTVELYEPLGRKGFVHPEILRFRDIYQSALYEYRAGHFQSALQLLNSIKGPKQLSIERLKGLSKQYLQAPPPVGWDGVTDYGVK